jgi:uncharacterized membrane protein YphA (DoxX/SURF4 family)
MKKFAPILVRIAMALVMLWFGSQQLLHAGNFTAYLPDWTSKLPISDITFVHLNGWFEVTFGLLLLAGFYTRIVALLLGLHVLGIATTFGLTELGVRDFGLACSTLSIFLNGPDVWSLDRVFGSTHSLAEIV